MKIAINTRFLLKDKLEGLGGVTYEITKRLVQNHPEHEFLFLFDRPYAEEFVFADNITPIKIFPPARHPFLFYLFYEWGIPPVIKKHNPDIFISMDNMTSIRAKCKKLLVMHDVAWRHYPEGVNKLVLKYYQHFTPKFLNTSDKIVSVSQYTKDDLIKQFNTASDKIDVIPNGCSTDFTPVTAPQQQAAQDKYAEGQPYFLYVGSIHPRKNIPRLLKAFEQFKTTSSSPIKLVLGGRMAWKTGEVGEALEAMQHKKDVIFLGYVSDTELPQLVGGAYASTYVSLFEGFGLPILEAMYADVPSITSNISSMPEVAGDAGLLADPTSVDSIAQQMLKIWSKEGLRDQLIEKGRIQKQQFSWDRAAELYWESIERTIAT
ncbi:MAG: glycosyltransferase family 4 protein [Aureispira sp.]|nr:glycosyltransferase family 4 protein [Aureispira sp.]